MGKIFPTRSSDFVIEFERDHTSLYSHNDLLHEKAQVRLASQHAWHDSKCVKKVAQLASYLLRLRELVGIGSTQDSIVRHYGDDDSWVLRYGVPRGRSNEEIPLHVMLDICAQSRIQRLYLDPLDLNAILHGKDIDLSLSVLTTQLQYVSEAALVFPIDSYHLEQPLMPGDLVRIARFMAALPNVQTLEIILPKQNVNDDWRMKPNQEACRMALKGDGPKLEEASITGLVDVDAYMLLGEVLSFVNKHNQSLRRLDLIDLNRTTWTSNELVLVDVPEGAVDWPEVVHLS